MEIFKAVGLGNIRKASSVGLGACIIVRGQRAEDVIQGCDRVTEQGGDSSCRGVEATGRTLAFMRFGRGNHWKA